MLPSGCFPFKRRSWLPSDPATTTTITNTTSTTTSTDTDPGSPLSRLFRSKSDTDVKKSSYKMKGSLSEMDVRRPSDRHRHNSTPPSSSSTSSHSSHSPSSSSSRRYRRVLRDVAPPRGDFSDDNPNVVHKFSKEYLEKHNIDKASSSSSAAPVPFSADQFGSRKDLPYEVSGSTILKRPLSVSESGAAASSAARTATSRPTISFGNEVEVIEFDKKEKVKARSSCMRRVQLSMDDGDVRCGGVEDDDDDTEEADDAEKENSRCRSGDMSSPRDERVLEQCE